MKTIQFTTLAGRVFENIPFCEEQFFDYMSNCGVTGIPPDNQIILFIHNLYEVELAKHPYDSVIQIEYFYTQEFTEKYEMVDNVLKFGV
jgi:hypothetical protein